MDTKILLISADDRLQTELIAVLSPSVQVLTYSDPEALLEALSQVAPTPARPDLILLHQPGDHDLPAICCTLRQHPLAGQLGLLVLLHDPDSRETVLAAGADDYLLLPLLPAELKRRLETYLRRSERSLDALAPVTDALSQDGLSAQAWARSLLVLTRTFGADQGWVFLRNSDDNGLTLAGGYKIPAQMQHWQTGLRDYVEGIFQGWVQHIAQTSAPPEIVQQPHSLGHHVHLPLSCNLRLVGFLTLSYRNLPGLTWLDYSRLRVIGQHLGSLLEIHRMQQDTLLYATQNAFILLLARTLSTRLDLQTVLSSTLEYSIELFNAGWAGIWLAESGRQTLFPAAALSSISSSGLPYPDLADTGIVDRVYQQGEWLNLRIPTDDHRFDFSGMPPEAEQAVAVLAVPLQYKAQTIGVLAVQSRLSRYGRRDVMLLEGIANLTAAATANARLIRVLRRNVEERRVLYEMSRDVTAGFDLRQNLVQALAWIKRLVPVDVGLLWLVDRSQPTQLYLAATLQDYLPDTRKIILRAGDGIAGQVLQTRQVFIANTAAEDQRLAAQLSTQIQTQIRNVVSLPLSSSTGNSDTILGVLSLANKARGRFTPEDITLLSTALKIVSIAIDNAHLHHQTLTLTRQRQALHQQILQTERLATVGRLTASLSHEINNPLQAIKGALSLAVEDPDNKADLATYLEISLSEADRVVALLHRMRQIYRPQTHAAALLSVNDVLQEAIRLVDKEFRRKHIDLDYHLHPDLPRLTAMGDQLHLVFLSLLLNFVSHLERVGGGILYLRTAPCDTGVSVRLSTQLSEGSRPDWHWVLQADTRKETEQSFGLSFSRDIVDAHGGSLVFHLDETLAECLITLPVNCEPVADVWKVTPQ